MNIRLARELPRLYLFNQVVERKSQADAAHALDISGATLNQHLKALRAFCGADIYTSRPRKTFITPQGLLLFEQTNAHFAEIEKILREISRGEFFNRTTELPPPADEPDGISLPRGLMP